MIANDSTELHRTPEEMVDFPRRFTLAEPRPVEESGTIRGIIVVGRVKSIYEHGFDDDG